MDNNEPIEPLTVTFDEAMRITGETRSQLYNLIAAGQIDAVKSGTKTLVVYASLKKRLANLPKLKLKRRLPPNLARAPE
jgi:hypothetical protein